MAIWPQPKTVETGISVLWLSPDVKLIHKNVDRHEWLEGFGRKRKEAIPPDTVRRAIGYPEDLIIKAFERFKTRVFTTTFIPSKFHPRKTCFEPSIKDRDCIYDIIIQEANRQPDASPEAYTIHLSSTDPIVIEACSPVGGLRALDSLTQLFYTHSLLPGEAYIPHVPVRVKDAPHFEYRGLNLDIARNWISPADVKRTIEAMSFCKLNKLHIHATDSQSWPLDIPALPHLAKEGAYSDEQIWTVQDLEKVQLHGLYHAVEVFLEIDTPGHTGSIVHGYPDLVVAYNKRPWGTFAQEPPSGQLKLNSPDVQTFITSLLGDLLPRTAPFSSSFHIGGDEFNKEVYALDPTVKSSSKEVIQPYLQRFMDHVISLVEAHKFIPHVWEDMLLEWDVKYPKHTIFQTWLPGSLAKVVQSGYHALFGEYSEWYLDQGFGTFLDPDPRNPNSSVKPPYASWAGGDKNWRRVLAYDPLKDIPETDQHLVLGGEVHLWCEQVDTVSIDFMLWPRAAAAAETMWKGKGEVGEPTTRRLSQMRERNVSCKLFDDFHQIHIHPSKKRHGVSTRVTWLSCSACFVVIIWVGDGHEIPSSGLVRLIG